jgi:hypothetical protein
MRSDFTAVALLVLSTTGCVVDGATVLAIVVTTEGATDVVELELLELDAVVGGVVVGGAVDGEVGGTVVEGAVVVGAVVVEAIVVVVVVVVLGSAFIYRTVTGLSLLF